MSVCLRKRLTLRRNQRRDFFRNSRQRRPFSFCAAERLVRAFWEGKGNHTSARRPIFGGDYSGCLDLQRSTAKD